MKPIRLLETVDNFDIENCYILKMTVCEHTLPYKE